MSFRVFVPVQLPDGRVERLPVVRRFDEGRAVLAELPTKKEARDWAEFVLPGKASFEGSP